MMFLKKRTVVRPIHPKTLDMRADTDVFRVTSADLADESVSGLLFCSIWPPLTIRINFVYYITIHNFVIPNRTDGSERLFDIGFYEC